MKKSVADAKQAAAAEATATSVAAMGEALELLHRKLDALLAHAGITEFLPPEAPAAEAMAAPEADGDQLVAIAPVAPAQPVEAPVGNEKPKAKTEGKGKNK